MSLGAVQLVQACDLAGKNSTNTDVLGRLKGTAPAKINSLIAASMHWRAVSLMSLFFLFYLLYLKL
jgi:hypothetical protein